MASRAVRLRALAAILRGERAVTAASRKALDRLLVEAGRALAAAGYSVDVLDSRNGVWTKAVVADVLPVIEDVFTRAFADASRGSVDASAYAVRHVEAVTNRLVGVSDEVYDVLRLAIVDGRQREESIPELAARVDALLSDDQRWTNRAVTIARTEVLSANNAGRAGAARATAAVLGEDESAVIKEWVATLDSRTRETHADADGQQVLGLSTPFDVGGDSLDAPGDPAGSPEEVINCRCVALYVYPGDPEYAAVQGTPYAGRPLAGDQGASTPAAPTPAASTVTEAAVDPGPSSDQDRMARSLTIQELQTEARRTRGSKDARAAARAELRRRGVTASAFAEEGDVTEVSPEAEVSPDAQAGDPLEVPTHAGVAVQAADTGRVLLIQRSLDQDDPPDVEGTWEFPGGGIEDEETPDAAAWREFTEETGLPVPPGEVTGGWLSPDGVYQGYVHTTPVEAAAFPHGINPAPEDRVAVDPDSPTAGRVPDVQAWMTLEQIDGLGPALRPAVRDNTDWTQFGAIVSEEGDVERQNDADTAEVAAAAAVMSRVDGRPALMHAANIRKGALQTGVSVGPYARAVAAAYAEGVPAPTGEVTDAEVPETASDIDPEAGQPFYGIIWPEDVQSGDARGIAPGATTHRDLPLPVMAQDAQAMGHDGAVRVGRIDSIERDDTTYAVPVMRYAGVWDTSAAALETARQVDKGVVRGISTDGDAVTVELRGSDGSVLDPMTDDFPEDGVVVEVATAARISGGTVCSIPAFHQAYIANGVLADRTDPEPGWNEDGTPKDNTLSGPAAPVTDTPVGDEEPMPLVASAGAPARRAPAWSITAGASVLPVVEGRYFSNPGLDSAAYVTEYPEGVPLTVDDDGRVYGHLAKWGTCHIGIDGYCQEPPISASNYAYYAKGVVLTDTGERVRVGPLTMGTGHAGMNLNMRAAVEHYDNTGTVVADVAIGQDGVGIWYSGRIRPTATPDEVYALAAAGAVSGDWREAVRHSGDLELVAALVVNTPGFAMPRPAVAASLETGLALVAAGMVHARDDAPAVQDVEAITAHVLAAIDRRDRAAAVASRVQAHRAAARNRRAAIVAARLRKG